jgi:hypothetical protein
MPRATWPLYRDKPRIEITLTQAIDGDQVVRNLLADSGAGSRRAQFELILDETDCITCGGYYLGMLPLGGAYSGSFPLYGLQVRIPALGFANDCRVIGVPRTPPHFGGIAGFRFINRFAYGNFGDPDLFGLEL